MLVLFLNSFGLCQRLVGTLVPCLVLGVGNHKENQHVTELRAFVCEGLQESTKSVKVRRYSSF